MMKCKKWNRRITQQSHEQVGGAINKIANKSQTSRAWGIACEQAPGEREKKELGERSVGGSPAHPDHFALRILQFRALFFRPFAG